LVGGIQLAEPLDDLVAALHRLGGQRLEETPADDLERLLRSRRPPRGIDAVDDVLEGLEGLLPALTANLDRRRRQADDEEGARDLVDGARELLGEREGGVERPAGQVVLAPLEPGVRDPFIDEDDEGRVCGEKRPERVGAGRDAGPVGLRDGRERRRAPEAPGELPPQRADLDPALGSGRDRREGRPDDRGAGHLRKDSDLRIRENALEAGQARHLHRRVDEVPEREHRVRLAATEGGLEVDDGFAAGAGEPPERAGQEEPQPLGDVRPGKKLAGVDVLLRAFIPGDLGKIRGELGLAIPAGSDIGVRGGEAPPGGEPLERFGRDRCGGGRLLLVLGLGDGVLHEDRRLRLGQVVGLGSGDGAEEALGGVVGAVDVVAGEGLLARVGPAVAGQAQLGHVVLLGHAERLPERFLPVEPDGVEQELGVTGIGRASSWPLRRLDG
jgi:hypothetical protein